MKPLIALVVLSSMGAAGTSLLLGPNGRIAPEPSPLPPLINLGISMGAPDTEPVVGACACHSPFAKALIMGGDRILSVDGTPVRSVEDVSRALSLARPKISIKFVILPAFRFEGSPPTKTVIVKFSPSWWRALPKKK